MLANNSSLNSVSGSCIEDKNFNAGYVMLMLTTLILLLPFAVQADGLFDFQMKLAKKGNAEAQYKVGEMYETGFGVKQNRKEAENWITKSANQGHETAGFKLLYWDVEKNGLNANNKAKLTELKTKAAKGNAPAQYYVGKMHARGVGLKKNPDIAIGWLNKAALVGVLEAERELTTVREERQRNTDALAKQRREDKKQTELKAKQQHEKKLKLEQQRKLQAQKKAEAKVRTVEAEKQKKAAERAVVDKKARLLAKNKAEKKQREAKKQALLKKRAAKKEQRKHQFESDPCSGKSARFLSTCR